MIMTNYNSRVWHKYTSEIVTTESGGKTEQKYSFNFMSIHE